MPRRNGKTEPETGHGVAGRGLGRAREGGMGWGGGEGGQAWGWGGSRTTLTLFLWGEQRARKVVRPVEGQEGWSGLRGGRDGLRKLYIRIKNNFSGFFGANNAATKWAGFASCKSG